MVFKALGIDVFSPEDREETRKTIDSLAKENYGVIFITERFATEVQETINRYDESMTPAIILIPDNQGTLGIGQARIDRFVEKAIGSNIL